MVLTEEEVRAVLRGERELRPEDIIIVTVEPGVAMKRMEEYRKWLREQGRR